MSAPVRDDDAIADAFARLRGAVFRFARARVRDDDTADDVVAETFARLLEKHATLDDPRRVAGFVFTTARHLIIDRQRRTRPTVDSDDALLVDDGPRADESDDRAIAREVAAWLPLFIEGLPETYRDAVRMSALEGKSMQEIADALGLSLSGAKSRVQRGRAQLKDALVACCAIDVDARGHVTGYERRDPGCACAVETNERP